MPIKILPPQLANQIAAGELVERPASVVKELIENSLDACATRIDINIEHGGAKMIRIRDNGCGIYKEELALAFARYATSKIACFNDLQCITSMGFRGEALASISSVSRFTLTSRPAEQNEAWQAYTEGRDMVIKLKPIAHPAGTTVEVLDLFYNTPARRKFMRTEKTEFSNIDEVVRRFALVCFDVIFILQHNGKIVRQYRAVNNKQQNQQLRRLSSLCGLTFVKQALAILWQQSNLSIHGWIADQSNGNLSEIQYSYVNRRIVHDKLISHAIRQACWHGQLIRAQQPAFVVFLNIDPCQVDVNVHPTKYEVRFHQARIIHDFIYQAVINALQHRVSIDLSTTGNELEADNQELKSRRSPCGHNMTLSVTSTFAVNDSQKFNNCSVTSQKNHYAILCNKHSSDDSSSYSKMNRSVFPLLDDNTLAVGVQQSLNEHQLSSLEDKSTNASNQCSFGRVLTIYPPCYVLLESDICLTLLSLPVAERCLIKHQLTIKSDNLYVQSLLIPLRITLCQKEITALKKYQGLLRDMGIILQIYQYQMILSAVPLILYRQNLQDLILNLLKYLSNEGSVTYHQIIDWFTQQLTCKSDAWSYTKVVQLLTEVEQRCPTLVETPPDKLLVHLNLEAAIRALNHHD